MDTLEQVVEFLDTHYPLPADHDGPGWPQTSWRHNGVTCEPCRNRKLATWPLLYTGGRGKVIAPLVGRLTASRPNMHRLQAVSAHRPTS